MSGAEPTAAEAFDAINAAAQEEAELARAAALAAATGGGSRKDKDHNLKQIMQERFDLYKVTSSGIENKKKLSIASMDMLL